MNTSKTRKAMGIVIKRLRNHDGLFDCEALFAIGSLSSNLNLSSEDLWQIVNQESVIEFLEPGVNKIKVIKALRETLGKKYKPMNPNSAVTGITGNEFVDYGEGNSSISLVVAKKIVEGDIYISLPHDVACRVQSHCEGLGAVIVLS